MGNKKGMRDMKDSLWQAVLGEIELSVSRASYITWFKNTQLLKNKDNVLVVGVPTVFVKNQLERKFNQLISDTLKKNGVEPDKIEYKIHTVSSSLHKRSSEEAAVVVAPTPAQPKPTNSTAQCDKFCAPSPNIRRPAGTHSAGITRRCRRDSGTWTP